MRKIAVLDQVTIDKIAAGEVVERPSSVVKELVENAIDAGASAVTVEIKDGGKTFLRITDNGSGIPKEQVSLAFLRHATSKIQKVEDLLEIASLGFRGEALSSISAVAQVELITKTASDMAGVRYIIEGGMEKSIEDIGAPEGTTFLVRNLFYNVPARSKFLKTAATEGGYISSLMEQMALSHPEVSFKYIMNGQVKLHTSGNGNQKDVIYQIYGRDITRELLKIHFKNEWIEIQGYIGKPTVSRGNRNFENYYINGRYVKNRILMRAIEDAYKGFLMQHQFPFVSLQISMTGNGLDVNVHPAKMEVRFSREQEVYQTLYRVLSDALYERELIPEVSFDRKQMPKKEMPKLSRASVPEPFEKSRQQTIQPKILCEETSYPDRKRKTILVAEKKEDRSPEQKTEQSKIPKPEMSSLEVSKLSDCVQKTEEANAPDQKTAMQKNHAEKPVAKEPFHQQSFLEQPMLSKQARRQHKLIGQLFDTYWMVQYGESLYIIDQHAAHEKVLYERIVRELESRTIHSQYLSPPIVLSLSMEEEELMLAQKQVFEKFGFELEHFGGREYNIRAVPANLYGVDQKAFFLELLGSLDKDTKQTPDILLHKLATAACKAAVKGNQKLSPAEADRLIDELLQLDNPYHCPHGRPTIISMTKTELEKKFRRIV